MAEVVNLNKFRKAKAKVADKKQAEENCIRFGRSKADKARDSAEAARSDTDLDGKKLD